MHSLDSPSRMAYRLGSMKITILLGGILAALSTSAMAELKIPSSVFRVDQIEEAKAKAAEDGEPLIIVFTDPGTT
jgi:hypothetical protein